MNIVVMKVHTRPVTVCGGLKIDDKVIDALRPLYVNSYVQVTDDMDPVFLVPEIDAYWKALMSIGEAYKSYADRPRGASLDKLLDTVSELTVTLPYKVQHYNMPTITSRPALADALLDMLPVDTKFEDWVTTSKTEYDTAKSQHPLVVYLNQIAGKLQEHDVSADVDMENDFDNVGKNDYLLRFSDDDCGQPLVIMGDGGVTWEPCRAYPTEKFGEISLEPHDDVSDEVETLLAILADYTGKDGK